MFFLGLILGLVGGGSLGVVIMALLQINRQTDRDE